MSSGASFWKNALIAPSKGRSIPGPFCRLLRLEYGMLMRLTQTRTPGGAVDGVDDLGFGGVVRHVPDAVEHCQVRAVDLFGQRDRVYRQADGGVGIAVDDLGGHVDRVV